MPTHTIGDCLYALEDCGPLNGALAEEVVTYPVIRVTEQHVYVYGRLVADEGGLFRLSRAELENEGCTYSRPLRALLHTRPGVDWPLIVVSVTKGPELELWTMPLPPAADLIALVQRSGPEVLDAYAGLEQQRNGQWR